MTEENEYDFKEDLEVDKYNLHLEWEKQATLYMKWSELHANALQEQDRAKEQLELTKANLDSSIRKNPDLFGLDKITESAISACIQKSEEYRAKQDELINSKRSVAILASAKEAMAHKKKAIEMLTQLVIFGYYSDPKIPKEFKERVQKAATKEISKDLNERMKRRRRGDVAKE